MKQQQPERRQFGITTIEVQDDEFFNGLQTVHLLHRVTPCTIPLIDSVIYTFLCQHLQGVTTTDRYRAGVISGWYAAIYGYHLSAPVPASGALSPREQA
jgi:hypothetical protein